MVPLSLSLIKVCASGRGPSQLDDAEHQKFSDAELRATVKEAGRVAIANVAAHCHGKASTVAALRAGDVRARHVSGQGAGAFDAGEGRDADTHARFR